MLKVKKLPKGLAKGHVLDLKHYQGRVHSIQGDTLSLTIWEAPEGRELFSNISRGEGVTETGLLSAGTPVFIWTWSEIAEGSERRDRLHLESMDRA